MTGDQCIKWCEEHKAVVIFDGPFVRLVAPGLSMHFGLSLESAIEKVKRESYYQQRKEKKLLNEWQKLAKTYWEEHHCIACCICHKVVVNAEEKKVSQAAMYKYSDYLPSVLGREIPTMDYNAPFWLCDECDPFLVGEKGEEPEEGYNDEMRIL